MTETHVLLRHREIENIDKLSVYLDHGGFSAFKKAITEMGPKNILEEVKKSGLRGRGGAGFPTGVKWNFCPDTLWPHYVVANADESEPGTFKDREILEQNPFQFLEGLMLASLAVKAKKSYIYLRGEFSSIAAKLDTKIAELEKEGLLGEGILCSEYSLNIYTHCGAGAYVCGEETALLESIEGRLGQPRLRPPFPAVHGLYASPTVINNVETLTNIPCIIQNGSSWFREFGTEKSPGVKIFSLSGRVNKPGNYELPLGTSFRELIFDHGGGILDNNNIKAIMTAGASSKILIATEKLLDSGMDYESVMDFGCALGSGSIIIIDDSINIAWLINKTTQFFKHESCGKCAPCREGTYWMSKLTSKIASNTYKPEDVKLLYDVAKKMQGKCLCALGEFSTVPVISGIENFPSDFELSDKSE